MTDFVGTNTANPGVYDVAREKAGPDAHKLVTNDVLTDFTAKFLNRDVLKAGNPGDGSFISHAHVQRIHGYDAGRAFMSACCNDDVLVEDFVAEHNAHDMLNCEPEGQAKGVTNVVMRRGAVGDCGYFALGSKGYGLPVSVLLEDIAQIPGTKCSNAVWVGGTPQTVRDVTLHRCSFVTARNLSDTAHFSDSYGVQCNPVGNPAKPIYAMNTRLTLVDVWIDGVPVTAADVQWQWTDSKGAIQGIPPTIVNTAGWTPALIAQPVNVPGWTTITPPPPPPPPPPPDEPTEVERLQFLLGLNEAAQAELQASLDACVAGRAAAEAARQTALAQIVALQAKIDAARVALG